MVKRPGMSKAELEVAKVIWELGEATLGQVVDAFPEERSIDYSTVQTYIRRLEAKGYLAVRRVGRNKVYRAKVRPGQVIGEKVRDFVDRVFDGKVTHFVRHLLDQQQLTPEELQELRQLIDAASDDEESPDD